jgi:hypothetical protein
MKICLAEESSYVERMCKPCLKDLTEQIYMPRSIGKPFGVLFYTDWSITVQKQFLTNSNPKRSKQFANRTHL